MLLALVYSWLRLLLDLVDVGQRVHDPEAELLLLRHQLCVVRRQVKRPRLNAADRTIMAVLSQRVSRAALVGMLVQPETVLGWHRELVRRRWAAFGRRRGPGRPGLDAEIQKLILQMAKNNPRWAASEFAASCSSSVIGSGRPRFASCWPEPNRARTLEIKAYVEGVSPSASVGDRAHRLPQRRHRASEAALRPLIYGVGDEAGALVRGDRPPRRCLGDPSKPGMSAGS